MKIEKVFNYKCDRCGKELSVTEKFTIFVKKPKEQSAKKIFDYCEKCYKAMERGTKKGKKNG